MATGTSNCTTAMATGTANCTKNRYVNIRCVARPRGHMCSSGHAPLVHI
jgi:hypothetical protein